jgi:hypothetical protein
VSLLAIHEPAYVSMSVLFESDYAFDIFSKYRNLFSRQDILRLAGTHDHLGGFILSKRDDYRLRQARYLRYFSDIWKDVEDVAPVIAVKRQDTTRYLRGRLMHRLSDPSTHRAIPGGVPTALVHRFVDCLARSGGAPITADLFAPIRGEVLTEEAGDTLQQLVNLQISMAYVESYMNEYRGSIPCGLRCGLRMFDKLSRSFPGHCLDIWREAYTALGIYPLVLSAPADDIIEIRNLAAHASFVSTVRKLLERFVKPPGTAPRAHDTWQIGSTLTHCLPRLGHDGSTSFVGFVANALEQGGSALGREPSITSGCPGMRHHCDGLYLDMERGALRANEQYVSCTRWPARCPATAGERRSDNSAITPSPISMPGTGMHGPRRKWQPSAISSRARSGEGSRRQGSANAMRSSEDYAARASPWVPGGRNQRYGASPRSVSSSVGGAMSAHMQ